MRVEPPIDALKANETADHQTGSYQQDQSQATLPLTRMPPVSGSGANEAVALRPARFSVSLTFAFDPRTAGTAEQYCAEQRKQESETEHPDIYPALIQAGHGFRKLREPRTPLPPRGQRQARCPAEEGQQDTSVRNRRKRRTPAGGAESATPMPISLAGPRFLSTTGSPHLEQAIRRTVKPTAPSRRNRGGPAILHE